MENSNLPELFQENRPWGNFMQFKNTSPSAIKIVTVEPNQSLSLQYHHGREEFWYIISGNGEVILGEETRKIKPGDTCFVKKEMKHRISSVDDKLVFLEFAFGDFDESDIVRIDDIYGRNK